MIIKNICFQYGQISSFSVLIKFFWIYSWIGSRVERDGWLLNPKDAIQTWACQVAFPARKKKKCPLEWEALLVGNVIIAHRHGSRARKIYSYRQKRNQRLSFTNCFLLKNILVCSDEYVRFKPNWTSAYDVCVHIVRIMLFICLLRHFILYSPLTNILFWILEMTVALQKA